MHFSELREFQRERRRLSRRYRSLPTDLQLFREVVAAVPPTPSRRIGILTQTPSLLIVKARLACKYLRNSSLRVIDGYFIHIIAQAISPKFGDASATGKPKARLDRLVYNLYKLTD